MELQGVFPSITSLEIANAADGFLKGGFYFLETGIGALNAYASLVRFHLRVRVERVLQLGIAGSYVVKGREVVKPGFPVIIASEVVADLGAEDSGSFLSLEDLGIGKIEYYECERVSVFDDLFGNSLKSLPVVSGATVNAATGSASTGINRAQKYSVEVESMEGAGVYKFGKDFGVPVLEVRSISNIASERDKGSWDIQGALGSLRKLCEALL